MTARRPTIRPLQTGLLAVYRGVAATGVLNSSWGRTLFEKAYWLYKARLEAGPVRELRALVRPGTSVIDVGANVGFFTLQFLSWVSEGGRVIAVEPEAVNCARLRRAVSRSRFAAAAEVVQAAASDRVGEALLELNPAHPGDHKLGTAGVPVPTTTLDALLAARGWPPVSLIKIDVQGAEPLVLAGARETLARSRPALFIEVQDVGLRRLGSSAAELLGQCAAAGYAFHALRAGLPPEPLTLDAALRLAEERGYTDLLLLPREQAA